jgi:RNA polymerase sigma-70 factor (ECF subfamily)
MEHGGERLLEDAAWVRALARTLAADAGLAEELEQETWAAVLRSRGDVRGALRPWLAQVMRNAARGIARSTANRRAREFAAAKAERQPSAAELVERAELQRVVVEELLALEEPFRSTVLCCYLEGLAPAELAARLGLPAATVRSRLSRALATLRIRLGRRLGIEPERLAPALVVLGGPGSVGKGALALGGMFAVKKLVAALVAVVLVGLVGWRAWDSAQPELSGSAPVEIFESTDGPEPKLPEATRIPASALAPQEMDSNVQSSQSAWARLVDERTHEPAAFFEARIERGADQWEPIVADSEGRLEIVLTPVQRASQSVRLLLAENEAGSDEIQTRSGSMPEFPRFLTIDLAAACVAPVEFAIPLGPTYRLALALPPGVEVDSLLPKLKSANPKQAFDFAYTTIRTGAEPWLRFRPTASLLEGAPPYRLELTSRDGLHFGAAEVPTNVGVHPELVRIALEPRARLTGKLRADTGKVLGGEWVRLAAPGASYASTTNRPRAALTDERGVFSFNAIPAGSYTLSAEVDGHAGATLEVTLVAGVAQECELVLAKLAEPEMVRLECTADSGTGEYDGPFFVVAFPVDGKPARHSVAIAWDDTSGAPRGRGSVELRKGTYRLKCEGAHFIEVDPPELVWSPGDAPPHFHIRDDAPHGIATFEAIDPANGERIPNIRVWVEFADVGLLNAHTIFIDNGIGRVEWAPLARAIRYSIEADGRQTAWGECLPTLDGTHVRRELSPGWSLQVVVNARDSGPLADVRILFDGVLVGVTDSKGVLRTSVERAPTSIRPELDGWRAMTSSTYDADTGRFRAGMTWLVLALEPVK